MSDRSEPISITGAPPDILPDAVHEATEHQ
jgi:hypothetical protein